MSKGRLSAGTVKVIGLDELRRELRKLDETGLTNELKDANYDVADMVVRGAQSRAGTPLQRRAAQSLKPSRAAARAQVIGGGAKAPFFGGAEFGSGRDQLRNTSRGPIRGWNQFEPWRGNGGGAGYFLYPAIRDLTSEIVEVYGEAVEKITAKAFPD